MSRLTVEIETRRHGFPDQRIIMLVTFGLHHVPAFPQAALDADLQLVSQMQIRAENLMIIFLRFGVEHGVPKGTPALEVVHVVAAVVREQQARRLQRRDPVDRGQAVSSFVFVGTVR